MTFEVFICFESTTGADFAEILQKALKRAGIKSFFSDLDLIPSEEWPEKRDAALEEASYFVILITYNSNVSPEVMKEYTKATNLNKTIIPCIYNIISKDKSQKLRNKQSICFKNNSELTNKVLASIDILKEKNQLLGKKEIEIKIDIEELWRRGDLLYEISKLEESLEMFIKVSELNPEIIEPLNNIGVILNGLNRFQEALEYFERALEIDPDANYILNNECISLLGLSKFQEAKDLVNNNIALNPKDGIAWSIKGIILEKLGDIKESKKVTKKAFNLNPEIPEILNNHALNLVKDRYFDDAIDIYDKALELNPKFTMGLFNRGIAFEKSYNFEKALESYDNYLEIDKKNVDVWNHKGIALAGLNRLKEAKETFDMVLKIDNLNLLAMSVKAQVLYDLGEIENAEILIDLALEVDENYPNALFVKGKLLKNSGKYVDALEYLEKAKENGLISCFFYLEKGYCLLKLNKLNDAEDCFTKAIQEEPEFADGWYNRGCTYALMKNKKAALEDLSKSIEIDFNYKNTALKDEDFKNIWDDTEFKKLVN